MKNKEKIIKTVIDQIEDHPDKTVPVNQLLFKYFVTGRSTSLRLTEEGKNLFLEADIAHYDFHINKKISLPQLIKLGNKITCPFYIGLEYSTEKKIPIIRRPDIYIRIYDHKIATLVTLYGDFVTYIDKLK